MFIKSITIQGIYPNTSSICGGSIGKRVSNYGVLSNGNKIQVDNFIMNGKTLRKDYYIENDTMKKSFHKIWDCTLNKFKKALTKYDWLNTRGCK